VRGSYLQLISVLLIILFLKSKRETEGNSYMKRIPQELCFHQNLSFKTVRVITQQ